MEFKEWLELQEGWGKRIPLFALGTAIALGAGSQFLPQPQAAPSKIIVQPDELGIQIPDSPTKGFAFHISDYKPLNINDIEISNIRGSGLGNIPVQAAIKGIGIDGIKKQAIETLNAQSDFGFQSLETSTNPDMSKAIGFSGKKIVVKLEDWPVRTGVPGLPTVYITGKAKLDLTNGKGWVAPAK